MKRLYKYFLTLSIGAVMIFGFQNCSKPNHDSPNDAVAALLAETIKQLGAGNCAVSINYGGLWNGLVINTAITGSANTTNTTDSATSFDLVDYNSAANASATNLATVSYNRKYDAFFTTSTGWTLEERNTALRFYRAFHNLQALLGGPAYICNASPTTGSDALQAEYQAVLDLLSTEEVTDLSTYFTVTASSVKALFTSCAAIATDATLTTLYTNVLGSTAAATTWAVKRASDTGLMACTRIPKASCGVGALTTSSRDADLKNAKATNFILNATDECAKPGDNFKKALIRSLLAGTPSDVDLSSYGFSNNDSTNEGVTGSTTSKPFQGNKIIASKAYPKFQTLVNLGFGYLMPMKEGTTAYDTTNSSETFMRNGSNINAVSVGSCDELGISRYPYPGHAQPRDLTTGIEVYYSFSANGTAATAYDAMSGVTGSATRGSSSYTDSTGATVNYTTPSISDEVACNAALRKATSVPEALASAAGNSYPYTLPEVQSTSGGPNQGAYLLSLCYYGGKDATAKAMVKAAIESTLGAGIAECSTTAKNSATQFPNMSTK